MEQLTNIKIKQRLQQKQKEKQVLNETLENSKRIFRVNKDCSRNKDRSNQHLIRANKDIEVESTRDLQQKAGY